MFTKKYYSENSFTAVILKHMCPTSHTKNAPCSHRPLGSVDRSTDQSDAESSDHDSRTWLLIFIAFQ